MVRSGAPISEEVSQARIEARARMVAAFGCAMSDLAASYVRFGEAARRAGHAFTSLRRAQGPHARPAPHAFTPNLDLRCTVRGCELGPEEHGP